MTEFTAEWIAQQRKYVTEHGTLNDQLCLELLDHIEHLQKRVNELEQERNNKCSDCCYVNPILDFWKNDTEYDDLPQPPKDGE